MLGEEIPCEIYKLDVEITANEELEKEIRRLKFELKKVKEDRDQLYQQVQYHKYQLPQHQVSQHQIQHQRPNFNDQELLPRGQHYYRHQIQDTRNWNQETQRKRTQELTCYRCHEKGHISRVCQTPLPKPNLNEQVSQN